MKKLTADKCRSVLEGYAWMRSEEIELSICDEYDLQAYEIALDVLVKQEERGEE